MSYAIGEGTVVAGEAVLVGCAAGPPGCSAGALVGAAAAVGVGVLIIIQQLYRARRPSGSCDDSASMGTFRDQLGRPFVVVFSRISCSKPQEYIQVNDYMHYESSLIAQDSYTCYSASLCEPDLIWGPYPSLGNYSGGNGATAAYLLSNGQYLYQSVDAYAGSFYYGG